MKLRRMMGTVLAAGALAACEGSATAPVTPAGPLLDRKDYPPGLLHEHNVPFDTSNIHTGYFGSGHHEPPPDTLHVAG
jgi:hypothetical protein